jgi:hypothetical protein
MTFSTIASLGVSLQGGGGSGGGGTASLPISGNGATVTASTPLVDGTQTWNNAAVTFTGLKYNATDTASAAASLLMDLQVGGVSRFSVAKSGLVAFATTGGTMTIGPSGFDVGTFGLTRIGQLAFGASSDVFIGRRGAATLRFGSIDAAAPVAQTLSVQSVVAGTTNTAGANLTITGSQGTGTGAGGSIIFQVAPAGSTGTAQNALVAALTIAASRQVTFGSSIVTGGDIYINGLSNIGFRTSSTGILVIANTSFNDFNRLQFGGTTSSFPALKRSSASLIVRLADDTANAALESASLTTDAPTGGTAATWKLGTVASVTPTLQNRTIEVDIGGTIYYISAKTTND